LEGRGTEQSLHTSAEVKNEWFHTSIPSAYLHDAYMANVFFFTSFFKMPCSLRRTATRTLGSPIVKLQTAAYMRCQKERAFHVLYCLAVY